MDKRIAFLKQKSYKLRYWSIVLPSQAGSGHTTTCLSAADIVSVLFFDVMRYNPDCFESFENDRFILSKGHASPLLYAAWHEVGVISEKDLMTYRSVDSVLEGHPTSRFLYAEHATGSLGMGLSFGVGQALHAKLRNKTFCTYVLLGDGEITEGSVWEAVQLAAYYALDNIVAIIDCNRLGQSTENMFGHQIEQYENIFTAFGWQSFIVDGHNIDALCTIFNEAKKITHKPVVILAKTIKGYGIKKFADKQGFHGKAVDNTLLDQFVQELQKTFSEDIKKQDYDWKKNVFIQKDCMHFNKHITPLQMPLSNYEKDNLIATRKAYGQALVSLGAVSDAIVSLDADVKNSTYAELFEKKYPTRFFQSFIAEQNMVGMAVGMQKRGDIPFVSTFSAFFSRAYDQIRMAAIGGAAIRLVGSHGGVSIGQDGPSQMGLEDIALLRAIPNSILLYPSDAVSTYALLGCMANYHDGISYMRTTRMETAIIYDNNHIFSIGGCTVLRQSSNDIAVVIGAGITLHEALKAYQILQKEQISIAVIDLYSIKPLDIDTILSVAKKANNRIIIVEDHYKQGGIGEAVMHACINQPMTIVHLAIDTLPRSGKPEELLHMMSINDFAIVHEVKKLC